MSLDSTYLQVSDGTQDAALMHITNSRSIGATTIQVDTVVGIPAKFIAAYGTLLPSGFIDPTTMRNFYGHLSGANLEIDGFCPGSADSANVPGQVVVIKPNTFWANMIATLALNTSNLLTGWIPITDSWAYASATTVTVPATASDLYSIGDRIRFTQTTEKFFTITAMTSTVLTLDGGGIYSVANAAITAKYYTKLFTPTNIIPSIIQITVATAVNLLKVTNAITTKPVIIEAQGSDANISVGLRAKGTGVTKISTAQRQNGATASPSLHKSVIVSGYEFVNGAGGTFITKAVTFPVTFSAAPIVTATFAGNNAALQTTYPPTAGNSAVSGCSLTAISTTGFSFYVGKLGIASYDPGTTFTNGVNYCVAWTAVGEVAD